MKRLLTSLAISLCCFGAVSTAVADGPRRHHDDRGHYSQRHKHHGKKHESRRGHRGPPPHARSYHRGPPPHARAHHHHHRRWSRGDRIPSYYMTPRYVVRDWQHRHFRRPPRGYQWVSVGADYFLVGIATGVILQSIINR